MCLHCLGEFSRRKWECKLEWSSSRRGYCAVTDGWAIFRGLNGLTEGDNLQLGVAKRNKKHVFVKVL